MRSLRKQLVRSPLPPSTFFHILHYFNVYLISFRRGESFKRVVQVASAFFSSLTAFVVLGLTTCALVFSTLVDSLHQHKNSKSLVCERGTEPLARVAYSRLLSSPKMGGIT